MTKLPLLEALPSLKSVPNCYGLAPEQGPEFRDSNAERDLQRLISDAHMAGFDLQVASGCRNFDRQLAIFNVKARGLRPVLDDAGQELKCTEFSDLDWLYAILRFSALPGTSRHHWGTDFDIYDANGLAKDQSVQLLASESEPGGPFYEFHRWLDGRIEAEQSYGFYRPYDQDRGGVACEPWHISHRPSADRYRQSLNADDLAIIIRRWTLP